jgi:hypothetical protein
MAPEIQPQKGGFAKTVEVTLSSAGEDEATIHYTLDGKEATQESPRYQHPLHLTESATVRARAFVSGVAGDGCPRGSGDLLGRAGICLRPNSRDVAALFSLDDVELPPADGTTAQTGRLCWLAVFSDRADTWIEIRSEVDEGFLGGPSGAREDGSVPAENWEPYPVAVDEEHFAFATATGKILLTEIQTGDTVRLDNLDQVVKFLAWDAASAGLQADLADGSRATVSVAARDLQRTGGKAGPHKTVVRARRPKRHQPPKAQPREPAFPLSWSTAHPIAITPDGTYAIAWRFVIHVPEQRTVCVLPHHWETIKQVAISKDGSRVFTNECKIRMFDGRTGELLRELHSPRMFALSPDETRIAGLRGQDVKIWDVNTGEEVLTIPCDCGWAIAWSPDSKTLAVAGAGAKLIDKATGQSVFCGGECVGGESVQLWDLESRQCVRDPTCGPLPAASGLSLAGFFLPLLQPMFRMGC